MNALDPLVLRLYDATDDPGTVPEALGALAAWTSETAAPRAHALLMTPNGAVLEDFRWGLSPEPFDRYLLEMGEDLRMAAARARPGEVLSDARDVDEKRCPGCAGSIDRAAFERSDFFRELLAPIDSTFSLFGTFPLGGDLILGQAFIRGRRDGAFEGRHAARMKQVLPHIGRVARLLGLQRAMEATRGDVTVALEALPSPVLLLDGAARVLASNRSAERLIQQRRIVTVGGRLSAVDPRQAQALAAAIHKALLLADVARPAGASTLKPAACTVGTPPLSMILHAVRPRSPFRSGAAAPATRVLAVVHDRAASVRLEPALVQQIYALTPTEAALASALVEGKTLAEFAALRGCTEETVRTHGKRLLGKVGVRRQSELVRDLLASAALHALR